MNNIKLLKKCLLVVDSCITKNQFINSINYYNLATKHLNDFECYYLELHIKKNKFYNKNINLNKK